MNWLHHITKLRAGETTSFRPHGNSMQGRVEDGQLCTVEPVKDPSALQVGDIVVVKVHGHIYFHLIKKIAVNGVRKFLIGNNKGHENGWANENSVYGRCIRIED